MYLSMIDKHIISIESKGMFLMMQHCLIQNAHSSNGDINEFKCSRYMV
jgi:hypothetical protein